MVVKAELLIRFRWPVPKHLKLKEREYLSEHKERRYEQGFILAHIQRWHFNLVKSLFTLHLYWETMTLLNVAIVHLAQ